MKRLKNQNGLLSLEASISLTMFIFLMLFLYSYFVVFEARNVMAQAALAATNSLSFDTYQTDKTHNDGLAEVIASNWKSNSPFYTTSEWYENKDSLSTKWNGNIYAPGSSAIANVNNEETKDEDFSDEYGNFAYVSSEFEDVIKTRFFAYLTGSSDTDEINKYLEKYHIVGGMNGISFADSRIVDGDLYIVVTYKLDYEFDVMDLLNITFTQSACSKLWK